MNNKQAVYQVLDNLESQEIHGSKLTSMVHKVLERELKKPFPSTVLTYARSYCDISGASLTCLNRHDSLYRFEKGVKISGAILD